MAEALYDDVSASNEMNVEIRPISGALGAELRGLDLNDLSDSDFDQLHELLLQYSVLAIHGQAHLTDEDLHTFGSKWGSPGCSWLFAYCRWFQGYAEHSVWAKGDAQARKVGIRTSAGKKSHPNSQCC